MQISLEVENERERRVEGSDGVDERREERRKGGMMKEKRGGREESGGMMERWRDRG